MRDDESVRPETNFYVVNINICLTRYNECVIRSIYASFQSKHHVQTHHDYDDVIQCGYIQWNDSKEQFMDSDISKSIKVFFFSGK